MNPLGAEALSRLRHQSHTGRVIQVHRALRRLDVHPSNWLHPLLLPLFFTGLLGAGVETITRLWARTFQLWVGLLGLDARVTAAPRDVGALFSYAVPTVELPAHLPGPGVLLATTLAVGLAMTASYLFARRHLPLVYGVWALGAIQLSAVVMLGHFPDHFPYDIRGHVASGMEMSLVLLFLVSWILAVAYYPLAFPIAYKLVATALILAYLIVYPPVQYLLHAWLIHHGGLLFMPLLFIVFGFLLNLVAFIALYGWAMSWGYRRP